MRHIDYCWKEKSPLGVLFTPRSDGHQYEHPVDLLFDTIAQANAWREQEINDTDDPAEVEYIKSWVLCQRTLEETPPEEEGGDDNRPAD